MADRLAERLVGRSVVYDLCVQSVSGVQKQPHLINKMNYVRHSTVYVCARACACVGANFHCYSMCLRVLFIRITCGRSLWTSDVM